MECKNSALCIFDKLHTQTDIIKSSVTDYFPITSLSSNGPIEFHIPGNTEDYVDVNDIHLNLKLKVLKATGKNIEAADKVGLINLPIASLFQDVSLTLGEVQIEGGQQSYPYMAYFNTVMQFHPAAQDEEGPGEVGGVLDCHAASARVSCTRETEDAPCMLLATYC